MSREVQVWGWPVEKWETLGVLVQAGALLLGVIGALYAVRQFWLSRDVRADQSRPYMTIAAKPGIAGAHIMDIVVTNIGSTPAHDVRIFVEPPLIGSLDREDAWSLSKARLFTETLPMWPPGHEVRAFFDSTIERSEREGDFPSQHQATMRYSNGRRGRKNTWTEVWTIDLDLNKGLTYTETYDVHHAAKALREIEKFIKKSPILKQAVVEATVEARTDRDARVTRQRAEQKERMQKFEQQQALAAGGEPQVDPDP